MGARRGCQWTILCGLRSVPWIWCLPAPPSLAHSGTAPSTIQPLAGPLAAIRVRHEAAYRHDELRGEFKKSAGALHGGPRRPARSVDPTTLPPPLLQGCYGGFFQPTEDPWGPALQCPDGFLCPEDLTCAILCLYGLDRPLPRHPAVLAILLLCFCCFPLIAAARGGGRSLLYTRLDGCVPLF